MVTLADHLKRAEQLADPVGRTEKGWRPFKVEGTRTNEHNIGYGHKLNEAEIDGNFIKLPDGSIHDFELFGEMTDQQIEELLQADIAESRRRAERDWNRFQKDVKFSSLSDRYQDVLTEIVFNIGTLRVKGSKGKKFEWKKLATAIKADKVEDVRNEINRKNPDTGETMTNRNNQVRDLIDNFESSRIERGDIKPAPLVDIEGEVRESIQRQLAEQNVPVSAPQEPTEALAEVTPTPEEVVPTPEEVVPTPEEVVPTPEEVVATAAEPVKAWTEEKEAELQALEALQAPAAGVEEEEEEEEAAQEGVWTEEKEAELQALGVLQKGPAFVEPEEGTTDQDLIERIF